MTDPLSIVLGTAATITTTGVVAGVTKLFSFSASLARFEMRLQHHIADEEGKFAQFAQQLRDLDAKLPNGELQEILEKLADMEARVCGGTHLHPYAHDKSPDRRKR